MISAWEIYWILQLDTLVGVSIGMSVAFGLMLVLALVFFIANSADGYEQEFHERGKTALKVLSPVFAFFLLAGTLLPSSKTAAAMFIIPAIANNETIQKEAADLYGLAKQALTEVVKPDEPNKE